VRGSAAHSYMFLCSLANALGRQRPPLRMNNLPAQVLEQIRAAIARPEGSVTFRWRSVDFLDRAKQGGYLVNLAALDHVFRLERSADLFLKFYHASPGTGTRVAAIDLKGLGPADQFYIAFTWSPAETKLYLGPLTGDASTGLLSASGQRAPFELRVGADGAMYTVGDVGNDTLGIAVFQAGKPILMPTALGTWRETKTAVEMLRKARSEEGYLFEVVVANLTLAALVTGLENYSKTRLGEIEREGIRAAAESVIRSFTTKRERDANFLDVFRVEAKAAGVSLLHYFIARGGINFQNYGQIKRAYSRAYGLRVGSLGMSSDDLALLKSFIHYRHRIVHVSPLTAWLNQATSPPDEPVFASAQTAAVAVRVFDDFIDRLHAATLALRLS
jgi:hypothetical protein